MAETPTDNIKLLTARTLKWNTIDKVLSQVLYAVTGIILANVVSKEEFGLVGSILIFQAFASLFVDSGFSFAIIQKKNPTDTDFSTVFYFNFAMSVAIYAVLWMAAPLIAEVFGSEKLIPLSRVMFLTFIINATAVVQTNRLTKMMTVKMVAVSNTIGLVVSGIVGVWLALAGYGAWAIVWQSITLATVKSAILWATSQWMPSFVFSFTSLRSIFKVGAGVLTTSFLNTVSLNIYNYIIGAYYSLTSLGIYTQADKWSKMGIASLSQIFTSSFLPLLSKFQDDKEQFLKTVAKTNRCVGYIMFPCFGVLIASSETIFHLLFGTKWDEAIPLFQLLLIRGIFVVITALYNNFIISIAKSKAMVYSELVKDLLLIVAIVLTIGESMTVLVLGQVACGAVFFAASLIITSRSMKCSAWLLVRDFLPYLAIATAAIIIPIMAAGYISNNLLLLAAQLVSGFGVYFLVCFVLGSKIQKDIFSYAFGRFLNRKS